MAGQEGAGELCELLLQASESVREALERSEVAR